MSTSELSGRMSKLKSELTNIQVETYNQSCKILNCTDVIREQMKDPAGNKDEILNWLNAIDSHAEYLKGYSS